MSTFGFSWWQRYVFECFFGIGAVLTRSLLLLWVIVLFHSKARQGQRLLLMKEQEKQKRPFLSHATSPKGLQGVEVLRWAGRLRLDVQGEGIAGRAGGSNVLNSLRRNLKSFSLVFVVCDCIQSLWVTGISVIYTTEMFLLGKAVCLQVDPPPQHEKV